jgi:hypothetical protein
MAGIGAFPNVRAPFSPCSGPLALDRKPRARQRLCLWTRVASGPLRTRQSAGERHLDEAASPQDGGSIQVGSRCFRAEAVSSMGARSAPRQNHGHNRHTPQKAKDRKTPRASASLCAPNSHLSPYAAQFSIQVVIQSCFFAVLRYLRPGVAGQRLTMTLRQAPARGFAPSTSEGEFAFRLATGPVSEIPGH